MKHLFTFLSAICLMSVVHAQTTTVTTSTTQNALTITQADELLTLKETEFDFGKIPQGKPVIHIFEVINKSNVPLKINNINAS